MRRVCFILLFVFSQIILANAQSIVRKFQNIPTAGIKAIAPMDKIFEGTPNLSVRLGEKTMTRNFILVEIVASGKNLPRHILNGLIDAGEFDLGFSVMDNQLLFHNHYPKTIIVFRKEKYTVELAYKIFVPKGMADLTELPTVTASR